MKYLEQLQQKKLFTLSDAIELTGNIDTAKSMLQAYKKKKYITGIRKNMYASLDIASKAIQANRFEIGSKINKTSYISYHSALEFHGIANQVFYTISVSSNERFSEFEIDGVTYTHCISKINGGIMSPPTFPLIKVTDIERTIIDCINDLDKAGGLEEVLEAIRLVPELNEKKLLIYLSEYNQIFLYQKVGFILEQFAQRLYISKDFFDICKSKINNRKKYLTDDDDKVYYSEWKLFAPARLLNILNDGGDELV